MREAEMSLVSICLWTMMDLLVQEEGNLQPAEAGSLLLGGHSSAPQLASKWCVNRQTSEVYIIQSDAATSMRVIVTRTPSCKKLGSYMQEVQLLTRSNVESKNVHTKQQQDSANFNSRGAPIGTTQRFTTTRIFLAYRTKVSGSKIP